MAKEDFKRDIQISILTVVPISASVEFHKCWITGGRESEFGVLRESVAALSAGLL